MLKTQLLCGVAAAALILGAGVEAQAADVVPAPVYAAPVYAAPVVPTWAGGYMGVHLGGGDINADGLFNPSEPPGAQWDDGDWGFVTGAHAGYNWQHDSWVYGIEGDVTSTAFSAFACNDDSFCGGGVDGSETATATVDMLASLRFRLGMDMGQSLVYATGGLAWRDGSWTASGSGLNTGDSDISEFGGVVGAGWEHRVHENFSWRVEGLYYFFDETEIPPNCTDCGSPSWESLGGAIPNTSFDSDPFVIRIGGSFHFR